MSPNSCTPCHRCVPRGFALLELLVILVLIGLIVGLVLPSLAKTRKKAIAQASLNYGRSIGVAFQKYADHHDGALVPISQPKPGEAEKVSWTELLGDYRDASVEAQNRQFAIGYNHQLSQLRSFGSILNPAMTVAFGDAGEIENPGEPNPDRWREAPRKSKHDRALVFETPGGKDWETSSNRMVNRHFGRASVVFADGRVVLVPVGAVGFQYKSGHSRALWDNK